MSVEDSHSFSSTLICHSTTDAVFTLNEEKVHKSEVVKKTLSPTWNESFECQIPSRVAARFNVDIYDVRCSCLTIALLG